MNPCGVAHFKNAPCRECERIRKRDEKPDLELAGSVSSPDLASQSGVIEESGKPARLAVTRTYTAEKQHRYRERKKATDPNYLSREAMRVRELRDAMKRQQA